jgi:hypothetical protein
VRRLLLPALLCLPVVLPAQWSTTLRFGSAATHGHARAVDDPDQPELRPDHPASVELLVGRRLGPWQLRALARHRSADLTVSGASASVTSRDAFDAWGFGAEIGRALAGAPQGPRLDATLGVSVDRWDLGGADRPRWHPEYRGGLELHVPVHGRWAGLVRGEAAATGSLFHDEDLPSGYQRRMGWSTGLALGVVKTW